MTLQDRDKRALGILGGALLLFLIYWIEIVENTRYVWFNRL